MPRTRSATKVLEMASSDPVAIEGQRSQCTSGRRGRMSKRSSTKMVTLESISDENEDAQRSVSRKKPKVQHLQPFYTLPLELLEMVLMKSVVTVFVYNHKTPESEQLAFTTLAGVSHDWWQTMIGYEQSDTRRWFRRETRRQLERACRPFCRRPSLQVIRVGQEIAGIVQRDDRIYLLHYYSSRIPVYDASSFDKLTEINVPVLKEPRDMTLCRQRGMIFITDYAKHCIWQLDRQHRVTTFVSDVKLPYTISVMSCRLLVTSHQDNNLRQFGAEGQLLKQICPPRRVDSPQHAVEINRGTFLVCYTGRKDWDMAQHQVVELNIQGRVIGLRGGLFDGPSYLVNYCGGLFHDPSHIALIDVGRVLVAGDMQNHIALLDKRLAYDRILVPCESKDRGKIVMLSRMCYVPEAGRLLIADGAHRLIVCSF